MYDADRFLLEFCRKLELLYEHACTANTHLHLHLRETFLDFSPPHAFWCFGFERYNGILGSYHTNKKAIEIQLLRVLSGSSCSWLATSII